MRNNGLTTGVRTLITILLLIVILILFFLAVKKGVLDAILK